MARIMETVLQKSAQGISELSIGALELSDRIIWINEIDHDSAISVVKKMRFLIAESSDPITLAISSHGGEVQAGLLILDAITTSGVDVVTCCVGTAYSMGAILLSAGKKRLILPNSSVMIHQPLINSCSGGSCDTIDSLAKSLNKTKDKLNVLLSSYTGKTIEEIEQATKFDNHMSAEEAIAFGLVDQVVDFKDMF